MDQASWSQKQHLSIILKLRLQKWVKINIYRNIKNAEVRCISHMEMLNTMLKYPEVVTNLKFIKVSTLTLELREGIIVDSDTETGDGAYGIDEVVNFLEVD